MFNRSHYTLRRSSLTLSLAITASLAACSEPAESNRNSESGSGGSSVRPATGGFAQSGAGTSATSGGGSPASGGVNAASGGAPTTSGGASSGGASSGGLGGAGAGSGGASGMGGGVAGADAGSGAGGMKTSMGGAGGSMAGSSSTGSGSLGNGMMMGSGKTDMRYQTVSISRDNVPYILITNGWGPGFGSHTVSWNGTAFTVENMMGSPGAMYQPASYPSVFCGKYSVKEVPECGLPASIDSIKTLRTGWRWAANGNSGQYNAAYDIWLGNGNNLQAYLMVWLRDPPGQQPAGQPNMQFKGVTVANAPGVWDIWNGSVNGLPIVNFVRAEGSDSSEIEFDVMDFVRDVKTRGLNLPGTSINAVAVGFEIWSGPITNLQTLDFYVDVN